MSQFGNAVSTARFALNPTPLGAAGLLGGMALGMMGGGKPWDPKFRVNAAGNYQFGDNQQQGWTNAPKQWATENPLLERNQLAQRIGLGGNGMGVSYSQPGQQQNPLSFMTGGNVNRNPNFTSSEQAAKMGAYKQGLQTFMKTNPGGFSGVKRAPVAMRTAMMG